MRIFKRLCIAVVMLFLILVVVLNILILQQQRYEDGLYRVEAKRLADEMGETGRYDLSKYPHISGVYADDDLYKSEEHYVIIESNGTLYRV